MEELLLVRPSAEYAEQIKEYRKEFLNAESSMDGTGQLKSIEDPYEWIKVCEQFNSEETVPKDKVPSTLFMCIRKEDNRLVWTES